MNSPRRLRPPPKRLRVRLDRVLAQGEERFATARFSEAREAFDSAYRLLLASQPQDARYDKSIPLVRRAVSERFAYPPNAALSRYSAILAVIESLITGLESKTTQAVAGAGPQTIRNAYELAYLPAWALSNWTSQISAWFAEGHDLGNPETLGEQLEIDIHLAIGAPSEPMPEPGMFDEPWLDRVFVGGNYLHHIAELNEICGSVRGQGFFPVIAWDYNIPNGLAHHHSLMLLHECRLAVFEVTAPGGQLMELERCRDYGIEPLVVYQGNDRFGHVSTMVADLMARLGDRPRRYADLDELRAHVAAYLTARR